MMVKSKILIIHNKYLKFGGEEVVIESQIELLKNHGHSVITYFRDSNEIKQMNNGNIKSFFSALHNKRSIKEIEALIEKENPDIVHIHNLFPLISPSVLPIIKNKGLPIVMTVHNYRLFCPSGLCLNKNKICEKCTTGIKELNCVINNCEGSLFKSSGYAIRNYWARKNKFYRDNIDAYLSLSSFQNQKLIENGFPEENCHIIPNMVRNYFLNDKKYVQGSFVGYVGRISSEKGSDIILEIAKEIPQVNFKIAGSIDTFEDSSEVPKNVEFVGFLDGDELINFYSNCIFTLFTSKCNETFGLTIIEAYAHKKPVISSNLGASSEIIEDNKTGMIYKDKDDLIDKIRYLTSNLDMVEKMGNNAFSRLMEHYTPEVYYDRILKVYEELIANSLKLENKI